MTTDLRAAAQAALDALEDHYRATNIGMGRKAADALRAALKEDAMQRLYDTGQELEAALAQPQAEPGEEYKRGYEEALNDCIRNGVPWARSLFANNAEHIKPQAEPLWIQSDHLAKARVAPFLCRVEPAQRDDFVPLYLAPRPPARMLTDEELDAFVGVSMNGVRSHLRSCMRAAIRAFCKANGIEVSE